MLAWILGSAQHPLASENGKSGDWGSVGRTLVLSPFLTSAQPSLPLPAVGIAHTRSQLFT